MFEQISSAMLWMDQGLAVAAELAWGTPLVVLILGGGIYFLGLSRLLPFRYLGHSIALLRGKYDHKDDPGDISHFQALSSALAGTIGKQPIIPAAQKKVAKGLKRGPRPSVITYIGPPCRLP